ncbi:MAG: AAA family ATPase [Chloroflexota bacterium]
MVGRVSSPLYVGRLPELERLGEAVAGVHDGAKLVVVAGDAGIGKTRLVAQFLARFAPDEIRILAGGCLALPGGGLPYAPLAEALRRFARDTEPAELGRLLGAARPELARLVPDLDPTWVVSPDRDARGDRADQARLFELVIGLIGRIGAEAPVVFVIEDVQWADDATRDLLTYLARNLGRERATLILTVRSDDPAVERVEPWLADLVQHTAAERIDLGPLTNVETLELLGGMLGDATDPTLAPSIVRRAAGNPLYVEELAAASRARGDARPHLPATLKQTLGARTRHLPAGATAVVRALAIAGREVDERLLAAVTGLSATELQASIHEAIDLRVVVADPDDESVALRHALLAEVVLSDLLAGERRQLHQDLAIALTNHPDLADPSPAGAAGELAHHWWAAQRPVEAFATALLAADAASAVYAHGEAFRHRHRALELWDRIAPTDRPYSADRVALILETEEAADLAGELTTAEGLIREGLSLVDPVAEPAVAGVLHSRLAYHRWLGGHVEDVLREHRRAVELVPAEPPSVERARVLRGLGGALMGDGRYRESLGVCEDAIKAARAAGAWVEEGRALDMIGMDRVGIGDIDGGIEALEAACAIAREHDPINGLIAGLHNLAYHLSLADRLEDARAVAFEGVAAAQRAGVERRYGVNLRAVAADILLRLGRTPEAEAVVEEARRLDRSGEGTLYLQIERIRLETTTGRFEAAQAIRERADRSATGDVDFDLVAYLRTAEAELCAWTGEFRSGASAVDQGLAVLEGRDDVFLSAPLLALGYRLAADRAAAARVAGRTDELAAAGATAERIGALHAEFVAARAAMGHPMTRGLTATLDMAAAERSRVEGGSDAQAWRHVAGVWTKLDRPVDAAYAWWRAAEADLIGRPERAAASRDLRAAAAAVTDSQHAPLRAAIESLAGLARISIDPELSVSGDGATARPAMPGPGGDRLETLGLSGREREVLSLVAAGRSNGEIGHALFISTKTASTHVSHIIAKLGVTNRIEAATMAARLGLVDGPLSGTLTPSTGSAGSATRTFMFTDIVGSTALIEVIGDEAWVDMRGWHDRTLRRLFVAHGGVEIDHAGDGFFVAFTPVGPALGCAVAIQRALDDHRREAGFAPQVRVAVHTGEAARSGRGYTGREVHLAARLLAHAEGGEIVATAPTMRAAGMRSARATQPVELAGIAEPIEIGWVSWR